MTAGEQLVATLLATLPKRLSHVRGVRRRMEEVIDRLGDDHPLVDVSPYRLTEAAVLHDVGYAPFLVDTGFHPLDGARYLEREGWNPIVVQLVAHHTSAVTEAEVRGLTDELSVYPLPPPGALKLISYADLTTGPTGNPVTVEERLTEIHDRYPAGSIVRSSVDRWSPSMIAVAGEIEEQMKR